MVTRSVVARSGPDLSETMAPRPVKLRFKLGDITVLQPTFAFICLETDAAPPQASVENPGISAETAPSSVDGVMLSSLPTEGHLPRLTLLSGWIRYIPEQYDRYRVNLQGSFEEYLKKFSSKSRSTLKRKVRNFARFSGGQVTWREFATVSEMQTFIGLASAVSKKTYQESLLRIPFVTNEQFRRDVLQMAEDDKVRGFALFHRDEPIAFLYCPLTQGILLYGRVGYDPDLAQWSPGTVLLYCVLEKLFKEGRYRAFDFGIGEGEHKAFWATDKSHCATIYFWRRTLRNLIIVLLHAGMDSLSRCCGRLMGLLRLKVLLKKLLRRWH